VDEIFRPDQAEHDDAILEKHQLQAGFILVVGNGQRHKNLGVLLDIAPMLSRKVVFVGVSENNRKYWQQGCHSVHTEWLTQVSDHDLPALLRKSFCLAQPSTAEGYGYPPLEAMACGVPAVVSDIPVLLETTGGSALAVDPAHAKAWKEAFDALENKTTYRTQIGKGLRWVDKFSGRRGWDKHISDIEKLLKGL
jgi:glycosyltransferase involved in cell wall biosynthesis